MLFTDTLFLFYFLPLALVVHTAATALTREKGAYGNLPRACLFLLTVIFYGCKEPWWLLPFFLCIGFDFLWARLLTRASSPRVRKLICTASVIQNVSLLAVFKYSEFLLRNLAHLWPGAVARLPRLFQDGHGLPLPPGISFYTFESLSFVIDVYRRATVAPASPLEFFAFIGMFPRFVAGPIVRYREMVGQFRSYAGPRLESGLWVFFVGLFLKTCFADNFEVFVDYAFHRMGAIDFLSAWLGVFSYTMQLYFDFSGYSLMAIGLGRCLGFEFPANFNRPYLATSLQDFWRRWHISLSTWLRDYLYVSLGGNRVGTLKLYRNLFLTMLIGGFWHGSEWTFVVWGAWHGLYLCLERALGLERRFRGLAGRLTTLLAVMTGWVFFKAAKLPEAFKILGAMFDPRLKLSSFDPDWLFKHPVAVVFSVVGVFYCFVLEKRLDVLAPGRVSVLSWRARGTALAMLACSIVFVLSTRTIPFLYFQF